MTASAFRRSVHDFIFSRLPDSEHEIVIELDERCFLEHSHLCGLEVTPACDYAQNKIGLSRLITAFAVAYEQHKIIKGGQFLKSAGPFYFSEKPFAPGSYMLFLNSGYVATAKPSQVKKLRAKARVRSQLLADIQSWASYQPARQGVMMLG